MLENFTFDHSALHVLPQFQTGGWIEGSEAVWAAVICVVGFATCLLFPKVNETSDSQLMPALG